MPGRPEVKILNDGWTVVTKDGSLSAHFEHTVLVTEGEPEILTCPDEDAIRVEGTVVEVLPNKLFRVELPNGHRCWRIWRQDAIEISAASGAGGQV